MQNLMEQEPVTKKQKGFLIYLSIFILFAVVVVILTVKYTTAMKKAANDALVKLEELATNYKPLNESGKPATINDDNLFALYKEKAYKEALITQSKADSMGLIVNLNDSSLTLAISGIPVFSTKFKSMRMAGSLENLSNKAYLFYYSKPFVVDSFHASFEKEPITRREAPKDTLEAANFFSTPDTSLNYRIISHYYFKNNIGLTIEQNLTDSKEDKNYVVKKQIDYFIDSFKKSMRGNTPEYNNDIVLYVNATDAMVIFRALPQKAHIVIYP